MTKDEALRLALEALEKVTKQMLAIRDELAERGGRPTNNFVHKELWDSSFDVYINCAIPTAEAIKFALEAKDEPVGLIESLKDAQPCCGQYATCWRACTPRGKFIGQRDAQRKPLDEEELEKLWDEATDHMEHFCSQYWDFARAIEAAHGIKGEA